MTNYTFIIPHKNIPDLLQRCLDSIPKREDIQIIIVDDNSDPTIVDFDHFPGLGQPNIEVYFEKTGKGAGRARNIGIQHAKGEWILFADADDVYITSNLDNLLNQEIDKYDVVAWPTYDQVDGSRFLSPTRWKDTLDSFEPKQSKTLFVYDNDVLDILYRLLEPWSKMIKRKHLVDHSVLFHETFLCEDYFFSEKLAIETSSIGLCSHPIYVHIKRQGSLSDAQQISKKVILIEEHFRVHRLLIDYGKEEYIENYKEYIQSVSRESIWLGLYLCFKQMRMVSVRHGIVSLINVVKNALSVRRIKKCLTR